jgi:TolC family type I secretion outer membrane protein
MAQARITAIGIRVAALSACVNLSACGLPFFESKKAPAPAVQTHAAQEVPVTLAQSTQLPSLSAAAPSAVDLPTALRGLLDTDPRLKADAARQDGVEANFQGARARLLPDVALGAGTTRIEDRARLAPTSTGRLDEWDYAVELRQPLYQGGQILAGVRQARALKASGESRTESTRQAVMLDASRAYLAVIREQRIEALRRENLDLVGKIMTGAQARFAKGAATRTDVALAESQQAFVEAELARAQGETEAARAGFQREFGAEPGALANPDVVDEALPLTLDAAIAAARKANPDLKSVQHEARAAGFAARGALGASLPSVDLRISHSDGEDDYFPTRRGEETRVAVRLSIPLVRAPAWAQARQARAEAKRADYEAQDVERAVMEAAISAWRRHEAEKRRLAALTTRADAAARAAVGVQREYDGGARTMQDLLQAQEQAVQATIDLERARADRLNAAYTLLAAVGGFQPDALR